MKKVHFTDDGVASVLQIFLIKIRTLPQITPPTLTKITPPDKCKKSEKNNKKSDILVEKQKEN